MAEDRTSFRKILTRGLAVMAMLCIYGLSAIGGSAVLLGASSTSALARGFGGFHGGGFRGGGFRGGGFGGFRGGGFRGGGFRGRGVGFGLGLGSGCCRITAIMATPIMATAVTTPITATRAFAMRFAGA